MRIGLVGYGFGGRVFHAPFITSTAGAVLAGVVTTSPQRRADVARDYPRVPCYDSLEQLLNAGVDGVVISTPPAGRKPLVLQAIAAGVPVVSDKPFALNAADGREMLMAAQRAGVPLTVYHNRRWDSDMRTVSALLEQGTLGRVRTFESRIQVHGPEKAGSSSGGGLLRDLGSHLVDQALTLFGPVEQVNAHVTFYEGDPQRDGEFFVTLVHACAVVSHLWGSCLQAFPLRMRVVGDAASYTVDGLDGQEAALLAGRTPRTEQERWGTEEHLRWGWLTRGQERQLIPREPGRWDLFYAQWVRALAGEGEVPVNPLDVIHGLEVLDAARESALTRQRVTLRATAAAGPLPELQGAPDESTSRRKAH